MGTSLVWRRTTLRPVRAPWALLLALAVLAVWAPRTAHAQVPPTLVRQCLADDGAGQALALSVDARNHQHLLRVRRASGDLIHTVLAPVDGVVVRTETVVAPRISRVGTDEVFDTALLVVGERLWACFYDAGRGGAWIAERVAGVWTGTRVVAGDAGRSCDLAWVDGAPFAALTVGDALHVAVPQGNAWQTTVVDAPGRAVGREVRIVRDAADRPVLFHRDATAGNLRVAWREGAVWRTADAAAVGSPVGLRPSPVRLADGRLAVFHGAQPVTPDVTSDAGLYLTVGRPGQAFESFILPPNAAGGATAAVPVDGQIALFARQLQRSALFGANDGLDLHFGNPVGNFPRTGLEFNGQAAQRHTYRYFAADLDPFGLPVLAYQDQRAAFFGEAASAPTCRYLPPDTDADGLPDAIEAELGTDPADWDTDGDGASDGQEVLVDGTDPRVADACLPSPETCNTLDDDCDGATDEGLDAACWPAGPATRGVGRCRDGVQRCVGGLTTACQGAVGPRAEICDGIDDDCDGRVDEGLDGAACAVGGAAQGLCAVGVRRCVAAALQCVAVNVPRAETCDARDEDCDGATDEGSQSCGVGACRVTVARCANGADNPCRPGFAAQFDALCDGVDDDCDGRTDEDYVGVNTTCGVGACFATGRRTCTQGVLADSCTPRAPGGADDQCDGNDNDCDGRTDEAFVASVAPCGVGACQRTGLRTCIGGLPRHDCAPGAPAAADATCDRLDDDCDGDVDEDASRPTTCGVGACAAAGSVLCQGGQSTVTCQPGAPAANDATCDGRDDDCDGRTDEDAVVRTVTCGLGVCARSVEVACGAPPEAAVCLPGPPGGPDVACDGLDTDCDGRVDEGFVGAPLACGVGACARVGLSTCVAGAVRDRCDAGAPAPSDATCDGVDDDCDGRTDEAFVGRATACGLGVCAAQGALACRNGDAVDDCRAGPPRGADNTCDGVDDDCDGRVDEAALAEAIVCGVGVCRAPGQRLCQAGAWVNQCAPNAPRGPDTTCDGLDDDCDGRSDEGFEGGASRCGLGLCARVGARSCTGGVVTDTCAPGAPAAADASCDGRDDDCDGRTDEDTRPEPTACGQGACAAVGVARCQAGVRIDDCRSGPPAALDATCDGRDDDCDGRTDEDFAPRDAPCGLGICAAVGPVRCVAGALVSACVPGLPAGTDLTCDGRDDDCDGRTDEGFVAAATACGVGECAAVGARRCVAGVPVDDCRPDAPEPGPDACDGRDSDCDGRTDEAAAAVPSTCGVGVCAAAGTVRCQGGAPVDDCAPRASSGPDSDCDGLDDDCDGRVDEAYVTTPTACGAGSCAAVGERRCTNGVVRDTCVPAPAPGGGGGVDATCDGVDDDCDGRIDEGFAPQPSACGRGACGAAGLRTCQAGRVVDSCQPAPPTGNDRDCDGVDDDCDGRVDEGHRPTRVTCGQGECAASGQLRCVAGVEQSTCAPGAPVGVDAACDGRDTDCDGRTDEGYVGRPLACGVGACARTPLSACVNGQETACVPGAAALTDATCDGRDDDCDGRTDEDFAPSGVRCGVGACAADGVLRCVAGQVQSACTPGIPSGVDATCDGADDDCDGRTDEAFVGAATACGVGVCAAAGQSRCEAGQARDDCRVGLPRGIDDTCDGADDDCDGRVDERVRTGRITCGVGSCANEGERRCVAGRLEDRCEPLFAAADDSTCNGTDDDCDGRVDEDARDRAVRCGVGLCARNGQERCVGAAWVRSCTPGAPAADDASCDGRDNDCDGRNDEAFVGADTACGLGTCQRSARRICRAGVESDACVPGAPAFDDGSCDGRDDDCDGRTDEDVAPVPLACGVGACAAVGEERCQGGRLVAGCTPGVPAAGDATCDGRDDDCDGRTDEGFVEQATTCGLGPCQAVGQSRCSDGRRLDSCRPGPAATFDATCDGRDDDCDGRPDEDFRGAVTFCGVGVCGAMDRLRCRDGRPADLCQPGLPAPRDATCDGLDDDCDGAADEDFAGRPETCGEGACRRVGPTRCVDGAEATTCTPEPAPSTDDRTCDGVDDDCDGRTDEDCAGAGDGGPGDGGPGDGGPGDGGPGDGGLGDGGPGDGGPGDGGPGDGGPGDGGPGDGGPGDLALGDADPGDGGAGDGMADAAPADSGTGDAGDGSAGPDGTLPCGADCTVDPPEHASRHRPTDGCDCAVGDGGGVPGSGLLLALAGLGLTRRRRGTAGTARRDGPR